MRLPEITNEVLEKFGIFDPVILIEWLVSEDQDCPKWTQTAVDFANLITQEEAKRPTDEVTLQGLLEYSTSDKVYDLGDVISFALQQNEEIERMRPVVAGALRFINAPDGQIAHEALMELFDIVKNFEATKP